ncbi:HD domain-containing protein [Bradyrhizobium oligotrophicum S58]
MSYDSVDTLRRRWLDNGNLSAIEVGLAKIGFDEKYVDDAIALAASSSAAAKSKVVKDQIWGMIDIDQSCLRLVDTPILQRLRGIKQTGFTYLTYPPAEHSRFSHSLGMMHVISRFVDAMKRQQPRTAAPTALFQYWDVDDTWSQLLKHAAILHDVGHMPFSHVTESILEADPSMFLCGPTTVNDFLFEVEDCLGKDTHLAECLSIAIILTSRFERFYKKCVFPAGPPEALLKIAAMIIGIPPEDGMPGLAGIVSGPSIDADKVDYINRDAAACGIPIGVDVSRLFVRSAFLTVQPAELERLRSSPSKQAETIFVVNASGLDSIEEISQARTALFHRVYLHQTTRNAERLLGIAVYEAALGWRDRAHFDPKDAVSLWSLDDSGLLTHLQKSALPRVEILGESIRNRRLPKRACVFGRRFARMALPLPDVFRSMDARARKSLRKQVVGPSLDRLRKKRLQGNDQRQFEADILAEMGRVADAVKKGRGSAPTQAASLATVIPMSNLEPNRSDCIVLESGRLSSTALTSISDEQLEAADIAKSLGYVLTDFAWREIAYVATRTVLYRRREPLVQVSLFPYAGGPEVVVSASSSILLDPDEVINRVGLDTERLREITNSAAHAGYFDGIPRLAQVDVPDSEISEAINHLLGFRGQGDWSISLESTKSFLAQFPPSLRRSVLNLIKRIRMLDRTELASSIQRTIKSLPKPAGGQKGFIVGLSPDSGNTARIWLEHDLRESLLVDGWVFKKTIRDVLEEAGLGDQVIFCDDNVTSGSQAVCQFMAWLDVPEDKWTEEQLQEVGIEKAPLSKNEQILLKQMQIRIVTAVGTASGRDSLAAALPPLGLSNFLGLFFGSEAPVDQAEVAEAENFFADVGKHVLAWAKYGATRLDDLTDKQRETCERNALGYSSAKALMCTSMNVPVGTLTAFWCPGIYGTDPWTPLLIRRGYLSKLVLS